MAADGINGDGEVTTSPENDQELLALFLREQVGEVDRQIATLTAIRQRLLDKAHVIESSKDI